MAFWDYKTGKIIYFKLVSCADHPGWQEVDCGCANGLEWGGEHPRECRTCGGSGYVFHHIKSGALASYPGGPFVGRLPQRMGCIA